MANYHSSAPPLCDYCGNHTALLFCRPDSAKLCFHCDREVHSTNQLFTKHTRFLLCDSCHDASATIFCETDRSVLCHNCDWETHSSGLVHSRRPVEGFTGCPSVAEILAFLGFEGCNLPGSLDGGKNISVGGGDDFSDSFFWEAPAYVSLDDLIFSDDKYDDLPTMDVPPPPKNRNATCGKYKEEILLQLRSLAKLEINSNFENMDDKAVVDLRFLDVEQNSELGKTNAACNHHADPVPVFDPLGPAVHRLGGEGNVKDYESSFLASNGKEANHQVDVNKEVDSGGGRYDGLAQHSMNSTLLPNFLQRAAQHDLNTQDRESALSRYKQKRKTRRYDKQVRYESRKVRAESRTRIRGRFAKMNHHHQ